MALAATWRFGIHSHVVTLSKVTAKGLLPSTEKEDTLAIFIEQAGDFGMRNKPARWKPSLTMHTTAMLFYGLSFIRKSAAR